MYNLKTSIIALILLVICCPVFLLAEESVQVPVQDSLVVVTSSAPMGKRAGNGFVIGDGTLVVTAHHLVFEESEKGQHEMAGLVTVFSPYLGDAADAEIVAVDEPLDLAILMVSWPGHPTLKLADDKSITSAESIEIIGLPAIIHNIGSDANSPFPEGLDVQRENLGVDFVAIRQEVLRFISLSEVGQLGDGWSGSPMLLQGTSTVTGCFTRLIRTNDKRPWKSQGPAITQVKRLLDNTGYAKALISGESIISRPKDGTDVFLLFLQAYSYYTAKKFELASEQMQLVIRSRPRSAFGYVLAASIAEQQGKYEQAEQYYQKALKLNPQGLQIKIMYAQFLSTRQPDKAIEVLQNMWESKKLKPTIALLMFNILSERGQHQRCTELLREAIKASPKNAYLWINLGASQLQLGKLDDAIASITKAVELLPERGLFRGGLAQTLEKVGRFDEAGNHFRQLVKLEPDNPVVHFWLAQFLRKHRPQAKEEALREAHIALELPSKGGLARQTIDQLIRDLQSQNAPTP